MKNHVLCDFHQRWIAHHAERTNQTFDQTIQMLFDMAEIYHDKMMKAGKGQEMVRELSALNLRRMNPKGKKGEGMSEKRLLLKYGNGTQEALVTDENDKVYVVQRIWKTAATSSKANALRSVHSLIKKNDERILAIDGKAVVHKPKRARKKKPSEKTAST